MIVLIDNYDSFSYNLYQLIGSVEPDIRVIRNDEMSVEELAALEPDAIVISPGPGRPEDAGICEDVVRELGACGASAADGASAEGRSPIPILGVCLGHQAIVEALGGTVGYAKELMHGKSSTVEVDERSRLLAGLSQDAQVARYHSLAADGDSLPDCLFVSAVDDKGEIMAVEHVEYPIFGVQFHPESIMTPDGKAIIENFMKMAQA